MTTTWTADELATIGRAEELQVSSYRSDGSLRPYVTIWTVRAGDDLYIRSAYGRDNGWFRRALASGRGRIRAGGVEKDVLFDGPGLCLRSYAAAVTGRPVAEVSPANLPPAWLGDIPHTHRAIDDARGYAHLLGVLFRRARQAAAGPEADRRDA